MTNSLNTAPRKTPSRKLAIFDELFPEQTEETKATRALLNTIFIRFGITNDFNFNQEFLSHLKYALKIGLTHNTHTDWNKFKDYQLPEIWPNWLKVISDALNRHMDKYGEKKTRKLPSQGTGSKPADCLLKNLHDNATENQIGLSLLYIAFLMLPTERSETFNTKEITRTFTNAITLDTVFEHIPLDVRHTPSENYLENISSFCQKLVSARQYGRKYTDFLRRLDDITRLLLTGQFKHHQDNTLNTLRPDAIGKKSKRNRPSTQRFTRFHELPQTEDYTPVGTYETLIEDSSEDHVLGIIDSNTDEPERLLVPKVNRDAELRVGSKFWIQNFAESTPWNQNGINPFTRKILTTWLSNNDSRESLILNLMLSVGLKIPALLNLNAGINKDINRNGQYRRTYITPKQHYTPDEANRKLLVPTHETFTLQLPSFVTRLLEKHIDKDTEYPSIAHALNTTVEKTEADISKVIEHLIKQGATGLARDRVHLSLRKQLSIMSGDDFLGYLITGSEKEAPPVSSYYSNISVSLIQKTYDKAIQEIFS